MDNIISNCRYYFYNLNDSDDVVTGLIAFIQVVIFKLETVYLYKVVYNFFRMYYQ